jgi:hypothetical protein
MNDYDPVYITSVRQRAMRELQNIGSGPVAWAVIGQYLEMVRSSGYWKQEGKNSFTQWLHSLASSVPCSEATLWRYHTAARLFKHVSEELAKLEIPSGPLAALPQSVSPENLELFSKLTRVAPADVLGRLAAQMIEGRITREELRRTWQAFRPALGWQTARGRGSPIPRVDRDDPEQRETLLEATILHALDVSRPTWTGCSDPVLYHLFLHVAPEPAPDPTMLRPVFGAVAVVRPDFDVALELHAIECVASPHAAGVRRKVSVAAKFSEYVWLASHESGMPSHNPGSLEGLPPGIGWLLLDAGIQVMRAAVRTKNPVYRASLLAALLGQALKG